MVITLEPNKVGKKEKESSRVRSQSQRLTWYTSTWKTKL